MHPRPAVTPAATLLAVLSTLAAAVKAQQSLPLEEGGTTALVHRYDEAEHWSLRALVLLSLGPDYHPAGAAMLASALQDRDVRLRAFAVEQVLRTGDRVRRTIATRELVDALVETLGNRNDLLRQRAQEALQHLLPDAAAADPAAWRRWWSQHRADHAPAPWTSAAQPKAGQGTVSHSVVERAFDLRDAGLEVVFVIDSTGSMQLAIDAARDAVDEVVAILAGVAPKLELGLVHYKDLGDLGDGAKLLVPLTRRHDDVREKLAKLQAQGGGDVPERIEKGIEVALDRATGWHQETNKMLLVIGDAPPHEEAKDELLELVRRAHEQPFARGKNPVTGPRRANVRPFVTSTIATSPTVRGVFEEIATAGGGTSVVLDVGAGGGRRGVVARPGGGVGAAAAPRRTAAQRIAEHVLLLSFGSGYEQQLRAFVDVFFAYRNAGLF